MYDNAVAEISRFRTVKHFRKEKIANLQGTYEMTGSPKIAGFKTKEEFIKTAKEKGFSHEGLGKSTTYLITDDYNSSSSKMAKATKLGVKIISYQDFLNL